MSKNKNLGEGRVEESTELELRQRLAEEITILRIEGTLFCFDPREARRRIGKLTNLPPLYPTGYPPCRVSGISVGY